MKYDKEPIIMDFKNFKFDEKKHVYTLDDKRLYGVTTVLNVISKPALIGWAAKMAVEDLIKNLPEIAKLWVEGKTEEAEKIVQQAKSAHRKKKDSAADVGKLVHSAIERWIKHKIQPELDEQGTVMFNHFLDWARDNSVKFLESEKRVYSEKMWLGGTLDMIFEKDGKKYVGDIKTTSGIYDRTPFFQCAAYDLMMRETEGLEVEGYCIVRLGKDGSFEEKYSYDLEGDRTGFKAALTLFKQLETYKNAGKNYKNI